MEKIHLSNIATFGIIMIAAGCCMVSFDLHRIYKLWIVQNWKIATGTISGVSRLGGIHIVITFTYSAFDGFTKQFKCSQTIPRDSWSENLVAGRLITVKYNPSKPNIALIQEKQIWSYILFGLLNSVWILIGLLTLGIRQ